MDERKRKVLTLLIEDYIATGEPVASRTLTKKYGLAVSPATVRNEMADLEDLGYLEQPHTSAGRVPSDLGYRYYVDQILERPYLEPSVLDWIQASYRAGVREIAWFMHQTARLVAAITAYPALVLAPTLAEARLVELGVIEMGPGTAVLVLKTDVGVVENRTVAVPEELSGADLKAIAAEFSFGLEGVLLKDLEAEIWRRLRRDLSRHRRFWEAVMEWAAAKDDDERMTVSGALNMLNYPEFRDVDRLRRVLGFLETEQEVGRLLMDHPGGSGVEVMIGAELPADAIRDCSVVTATYQLGGTVVGKLLVLGPRRMKYGRVIGVLEAVSAELSRALKWA